MAACGGTGSGSVLVGCCCCGQWRIGLRLLGSEAGLRLGVIREIAGHLITEAIKTKGENYSLLDEYYPTVM